MLVLKIKKGEHILIGPDIKIAIAYQRGDSVGVAINAPLTFDIVRSTAKNKQPKERQAK